jgi:MOSC domain-containing protein YiiM
VADSVLRSINVSNGGGPERALCRYSLELVQALRLEGHPIALELVSYASPRTNIAASFRDGNIKRVSQKVHPGWSRLCARVLREGTVRAGDVISLPGP